MKKKIAIISNASWNLYNFRLSLMKAMQNAGYEVVAIAPYDEYSKKIIDEGFEYQSITINAHGINPFQDMKTTIEFYQLLKNLSPDFICNYTIKPNVYASFVARVLNIKIINNIAGLGTLFIKEGAVTSIAKILYKASQSKVDRVFFQNREDFNFFVDAGLVNSANCDILPGSGVDTERFRPQEQPQRDTIRFLHISRMIWEKGIGQYVDAARIIKAKYPNVEFCLLGFLEPTNPGAISAKQMKAWVEEGVINYLGVSDDVDKVITTADCVVLPSYYREGTPKVLLESASSAKPIITTDNVGCRDVVDDGVNGYLCKPRSVVDLVEKMEMFLALTKEEKDAMGIKSREKVKNEFDEKIVIGKYLEVLSSYSEERVSEFSKVERV